MKQKNIIKSKNSKVIFQNKNLKITKLKNMKIIWLIVTLSILVESINCYIFLPSKFRDNDMFFAAKSDFNSRLKEKIYKKSAGFDRLKYSGSWIRIGKRNNYIFDYYENDDHDRNNQFLKY